MGRLIDADAIHYHQMWEEDWTKQTIYFGHGVPEWEIDEMPTVDAEPVRHGKWLCSDDMYETAVCSVCNYDTEEPYEYVKKSWNFCLNCGAKMDGTERKEE